MDCVCLCLYFAETFYDLISGLVDLSMGVCTKSTPIYIHLHISMYVYEAYIFTCMGLVRAYTCTHIHLSMDMKETMTKTGEHLEHF